MPLAKITFHVQDGQGHPIGGCLLEAVSPNGNWQGRTEATGDFVANLAAGHYDITFTALGFAQRTLPADLGNPGTVTVGLELSAGRIHVEGLNFIQDSQPWTMAFMDGFRDYERFLNGQDIRPVLNEAGNLGANGRRVFGAFDFGTPDQQRLYPREHGDYYEKLQPFHALCAEFGLTVQFCVFADTKRSVPGADSQKEHWQKVCDALRPVPNVLLQRVNENNQHENGVDADLAKPAGLCSSFGSNGTGDDPPQPFWDYVDLGSERRPDRMSLSTTTVFFAINGYQGEGGNPGFPGSHRATVVSEPPKLGVHILNARDAYLLGLGCQWGNGGTAHSQSALMSVLLNPTERELTKEFLRGVKAR